MSTPQACTDVRKTRGNKLVLRLGVVAKSTWPFDWSQLFAQGVHRVVSAIQTSSKFAFAGMDFGSALRAAQASITVVEKCEYYKRCIFLLLENGRLLNEHLVRFTNLLQVCSPEPLCPKSASHLPHVAD